MPLFVLDKGFLGLDTRALSRRVVVSLLVLVLVIPAIYRSWGIYRADRILRHSITPGSYDQALSHDSSNSSYWWRRGRMFHHSIEAVDIPQAVRDYQRSLALNPRSGQVWIDLADCYERLGDFARAEKALENAFATRPFSPLIRWQAGNFYLRRGDLAKMYESFKLACEYDREKLGIAMETAWKVDPDRTGILERLIPDNLAANLAYLNFLLSRGELDLARAAWDRSLKNGDPNEVGYKVSTSFGYIDQLVNKNRIADAQRVWDEALQKSGIGLRDNRPRPKNRDQADRLETNLVWNGSFENEILQGGFDWRPSNTNEVQFETDLNKRMDGLKSLRVTFAGANTALSHLYQIVPVPQPGTYQLEYYLQTVELTTDQRPYISIQGYPEVRGAAFRTEKFSESSAWRKSSFLFTVNEGCQAIQLTLRRDPSSKFDNLIKGSLWLDDISIHLVQRATSPEATRKSRN